ncbi:sensor histidine kinase [Amycolatopsis vastitatis]|uniref:sensor histidine kinase n=1 Tax=Amycolatopsis vastitatis TaxID=1905142 RepID=UPI0011774316|nr:HAMP domain-containing sensor histidine kinase [Amycolatopsis vastitatis]
MTALVVLALWQFDRWDGVPLGSPARDAGAVLALAAAGVATAAAVVAALGPAEAGRRRQAAVGHRRPFGTGRRNHGVAGRGNPAEPGRRNPAEARRGNPAEAVLRNPAEAGSRKPAEADHQRSAATGRRNPAEIGRGKPTRAGYRRLAAPLGFYGLVVIPAGVVGAAGPGMTIVRFAAGCFFLVLAATALPVSTRLRRPFALAGSLLAAGTVVALSQGAPEAAHVIVVGGWWVVAAGFVAAGTARAEPATWRIGIGLSLVALAHLEAFTGVPEFPSSPELELGGLRLLGLVVVLVVLARPVAGALRAVRGAAEREHEIRNVLSGLSGVGYLLGAGPDTLDRGARAELASAMRAELERVGELLGGLPDDQDGDTLLRPVLTRLVALRCARGERVELDVAPCLRVAMPAHALTQVLTNLLANCDRHAPGSRVRVAAAADGDRVTITVADDGPGLPGEGRAEPGIGLNVCTRLLAEHGGHLWLSPPGPGCTVEVRLPAVADVPAARGSPVRVGFPQVV